MLKYTLRKAATDQHLLKPGKVCKSPKICKPEKVVTLEKGRQTFQRKKCFYYVIYM